MTHDTRQQSECGIKLHHLAVMAFFLCSTIMAQAATNWVSGTAYGTNYAALATAGSIDSIESAAGSLIIGHESTTNLTLSHDISGFVAVTNQTEGVAVNATGATLSASEGTVAAFMALGASNLTVTGGQFYGLEKSNSGGGPPLPGQDAIGGWITNSTAVTPV
jgi:hypothetical protein